MHRRAAAILALGTLTAATLTVAPSAAAADGATHYLVSRSGTTYTATPSPSGSTYTGTLKSAVENAVADLEVLASPGSPGTVEFTAGVFDFGTQYFKFDNIHDITFVGAGMTQTTVRNNTNAAADTEPFNFSGAFRVTIRDLTVEAGGTYRSTSDALDFDQGNDSLVERVRITQSRSRAIVFDGKNAGWTAEGNTVRDCVIDGAPLDGIQFLASSRNRVETCSITNVGRHGIYMDKSSTSAPQPNKKSSDNVIIGNSIDQAGQNGIAVNSGDRNEITGNTVTNSSDDVSNRDGIRIFSSNSITCNDNVVDSNTATDTQATKTQKYGLNIASSLCSRTVVGTNNFAGNKTADINDVGTGTIYQSTPDNEAPSVPAGLAATAAGAFAVDLAWDAATDNVAVDGYGIYRDGALVTEVGGATLAFTDTALSPSTTYGYQVDAFDAAGNRSARSATVNVTTGPQGTATLHLTPSEDAYVNAANANANYGSSTQLRVDGSPIVRSYLRTTVPAVTVTGAVLRIYANSGSSTGLEAYATNGGAWTASTITYNNAPPLAGARIAATGSFGAATYVELDVTALVAAGAGGDVDIVVTGPGSTAVSLSSTEGANAPELVVTTG